MRSDELPGGRTVTTLTDKIEKVLWQHTHKGRPEWDQCPCWCGENAVNLQQHQAEKIIELLEAEGLGGAP